MLPGPRSAVCLPLAGGAGWHGLAGWSAGCPGVAGGLRLHADGQRVAVSTWGCFGPSYCVVLFFFNKIILCIIFFIFGCPNIILGPSMYVQILRLVLEATQGFLWSW